MLDWFTGFVERIFRVPVARTRRVLHLWGVVAAAASFVLISTVLVAFDSIFFSTNNVANLQIGDSAPYDIRAPINLSYVSAVLTDQRKEEIRRTVPEVYFLPDPAIARQQTDLARQILDYIDNVRRDPYGTQGQKAQDLRYITDLTLDETVVGDLLTINDEDWREVDAQITNVLERVMRGEIRESNLPGVIAQLPVQVSVRFSEEEADVIVALVEDLLRPNTQLNAEATAAEQEAAVANVEVRRTFDRGEFVVRGGDSIDAAAYEAFGKLGLLDPTDRRIQDTIQALLASILVMIVMGLYISRFKPSLYTSSRFLALLAGGFLLALLGARVAGANGQFHLYPTAAMTLLLVAVVGTDVAIIGTLGLALLVALMQEKSLEIAVLVIAGGLIAALTLKRSERLNSYFLPGFLVALTNIIVVTIFFQGPVGSDSPSLVDLIIYGLVNGVLVTAATLVALYIITLVFNIPTGLKLLELSQPNHPLLQRLLREAPGTYQHSLQVSNLSEQAANAIGADATLVRVAALYHDIGKMLNAPFFTENQVEGVNPHDTLNDPQRSADIIISHVTDGDKMARQYRLPNRIRDFILEHHGTQVLYFYHQAVAQAGATDAIDIEQYTYPGPRPRSRETAILMLADSCEAAVRSRKPTKKQEIADTIQQVFDGKIRGGQLDDSGLTLNDINSIRKIFTDMLQAVFHPRISYPAAPGKAVSPPRQEPATAPETAQKARVNALELPVKQTGEEKSAEGGEVKPPADAPPPSVKPPLKTHTREIPAVKLVDDNDNAPLPDVPPLPPRTGEQKAVRLDDNGKPEKKPDVSEGRPSS